MLRVSMKPQGFIDLLPCPPERMESAFCRVSGGDSDAWRPHPKAPAGPGSASETGGRTDRHRQHHDHKFGIGSHEPQVSILPSHQAIPGPPADPGHREVAGHTQSPPIRSRLVAEAGGTRSRCRPKYAGQVGAGRAGSDRSVRRTGSGLVGENLNGPYDRERAAVGRRDLLLVERLPHAHVRQHPFISQREADPHAHGRPGAFPGGNHRHNPARVPEVRVGVQRDADRLFSLDAALVRECCSSGTHWRYSWSLDARTSTIFGMESRVHPKCKTKYHVGNRPEYERALVQRGDVTLWLSADAIAAWTPQVSGRRGGQRKFSDLSIETALTLSSSSGCRFAKRRASCGRCCQ